MNKFKKIMMSGHTQGKDYLHRLYTDKQVYISSVSSSEQPVEEEKLFHYGDISFRFVGTGYRTIERMVIFVDIPQELLCHDGEPGENTAAYEDYLLRIISGDINALSESYKNDRKTAREKPSFSMQTVNSVVHKRSGCIYRREYRSFRLRVHFTCALINGVNINGKSSFKAVKEILELIHDRVYGIQSERLKEHIELYMRQTELRSYLGENNLAAFIGDGSILPRKGNSDEPMPEAAPFAAPEELKVSISLSDGSVISGMAIKKGITVITGGGYSGKSTLLNAIEAGIYNHIGGDGREYVIADGSAVKIYAEDGRYICDTDISPFFSHMSKNTDVHCFSTECASGSVSQAAGIIEALYGESRCLLLDEDTSAANFMIRDDNMRMLVKNEPIIPFTDRISELKSKGVAVIMVIGGSGEYLKYADTVILMEDYEPIDRTLYVKENMLLSGSNGSKEDDYRWMRNRTMNKWQAPDSRIADGFYSECIQIENARYIKIDNYVSDITRITSVVSDCQISSLAYLLEKLLEDEEENAELRDKCREKTAVMFESAADSVSSNARKYELWLEEVRPLDLLMAACRMRRSEPQLSID